MNFLQILHWPRGCCWAGIVEAEHELPALWGPLSRRRGPGPPHMAVVWLAAVGVPANTEDAGREEGVAAEERDADAK